MFIRDFIRGYLDGDGWITHRTGRNEVDLGFVCGNKNFLEEVRKIIQNLLRISGRVRRKSKITSKGVYSTTYLLEYYSSNAVDIANWLYGNLVVGNLYLKRKYSKYMEARKIYEEIWLRFRSKRLIQKIYSKSLKDILTNLHIDQQLNGMEISRRLKTSKSSVYRWLEATGTK